MIRVKTFGEKVVLKTILPTEIEKLEENKIIAVNRIYANKRLMEIRVSPNPDLQAAKIITCALKEARSRERRRTGSVANITMTVGELKRAFNPVKELPSNSLKLVVRY